MRKLTIIRDCMAESSAKSKRQFKKGESFPIEFVTDIGWAWKCLLGYKAGEWAFPKSACEFNGGNIKRCSEEGIGFIKAFEGCRLNSYRCPAGVWTIGYGHTKTAKPGQSISDFKATQLLKQDLERFEVAANRYSDLGLNQAQFDAIVSFLFNCGESALLGTRTGALLEKRNLEGFADALLQWNKAGGRAITGLTRRRKAERRLFLTGNYSTT